MRVLIAGDTHGTMNSARLLNHLAQENEVDEIWQCGDLGFWPRDTRGVRFIAELRRLPVPLYFADGNHEDHSQLLHDEEEPYEITRGVWHVPRGVVREVGGRRVMFFGGARSVDRIYRKEGIEWFAEELPDERAGERVLEAGEVDIVVAHDAPSWVEYGYPPHHEAMWPMQDLIIGSRFREELSKLAELCEPLLWFNGHHHRFTHQFNETTDVYTLAHSISEPGKWAVVLDLDTLEVTSG